MRSGTELSQFLRVFLPTFVTANVVAIAIFEVILFDTTLLNIVFDR